MSETREHLKYARTHEWADTRGAEVTVGVSDFAVEALSKEIVFVELPTPGSIVVQNSPFGVIEAVKAAYDLLAPVSGTVVAVNEELEADPSKIAESPYEKGWMIRIAPSDLSEIDVLLSAEEYREQVESEEN